MSRHKQHRLRLHIICPDCGAKYGNGQAAHLRSKIHTYAPKLREWFSDPRTTLTDAAERLNCTREYVRQMLRKIGMEPRRKYLTMRRVNASEKSRVEKFRQVAKSWSFTPLLRRRGFTLERVDMDGPPAIAGEILSQQLYINGRRCIIRHTSKAGHPWPAGYIHIQQFTPSAYGGHDKVDFVLYRLYNGAPLKGWLVIPAEKAPNYGRIIRLRNVRPNYDKGKRAAHIVEWRRFHNAWDQLAIPAAGYEAITEIPSESIGEWEEKEDAAFAVTG